DATRRAPRRARRPAGPGNGPAPTPPPAHRRPEQPPPEPARGPAATALRIDRMPKSAKARSLENVPPPSPEPLAVPVADSHTHLDMQQDRTGTPVAEALERAAAVGVTRVVQIGCDLPRARW